MFNSTIPTIDWIAITPILIVVITGIAALVLEMIHPKRNNNAIVAASLIGLAIAAIPILTGFSMDDRESLGGMFVSDRFGLSIQLLLVGSAFLSVLFSEGYLREKRIPFGEFYPLILWSTAGAMIMSTSHNLLMIFLGIEILSIALYVMAGMARSEERSEESALKYFLLGAFATGFLLYGIAFLYGATGSLDVRAVGAAWQSHEPSIRSMLLFGLGLMLIGLSFKSAFVPFHQWTPDVYQGAPTNVTAFMAAGSKIGAIAALWRVLDGSLALADYWMPALFWIAILTMTVGNVVALVQKDAKRILGYSSIAHAGYVLVGVMAHFKNPANTTDWSVVFYLLSYSLMTIGAFAVISMTARSGREDTKLSELNGLWQRSPLAAVTLIIFVASLIGIPPTAGFVGKFLIFSDALAAGLAPLAIVLAINSAISIYYYLSLVLAAFVEEPDAGEARTARMHPGLAGACILCAAGIIGATIFYGPLQSVIGAR